MSDERATRSGDGRRLTRWLSDLPRWLRIVLGAAAVALGAILIVRPTTSLGVLAIFFGVGFILTGVLELIGGSEGDAPTPRWRVYMGLLWIVAGVVVLVWLGLTVRVLALVVAVGLLVNGVLSIVSAFRRSATPDARISAALLGLAGVAFGLLALLWPDITLLVVAVVFGASLIIGGLLEVWHAVRGTRPKHKTGPPSALARWARTIAAVVVLVLAIGAGAVSASLREGSPVVDDFYAAARDVPGEPGRLIRAEPFARGIPGNARGWRILYTTTNGDGSPAVASGLVVVPADGGGDYPVIDWTHGTTGFAQQCAPSLAEEPFESGAFFLVPDIVDRGWAVVATDYIGLGTEGPHPYLIGVPAAHAGLDARRAAAELSEARLGDQTVVWGHSQGGGAALWTGALADQYAPELDIAGVAALAPASDLPALVENLPNVPGGSVFGAFVTAAYTAIYDDVAFRDYVRPGAEVTLRQMASRCLAEPGVFVSLLTLLGLSQDPDLLSRSPIEGAFGKRLAENVPPPTISAPLLLGQGADDSLVVPDAQDAYVQSLCDAGQQVDYRVYAGRNHVPLVEPDSPLVPELFEWTTARFAGDPVEPGCSRTEH
ncbi:lipase family protein [Microbacterium sp. BWT-B31]|uniref:lipase family protein n=1 Tax=Microbacterium sp. BWT-B31 TaxID=3232072 RepID=UPI003527C15B